MGNTYEVSGWVFRDRHGFGRPDWHYEEVYRGESLVAALWHAMRARSRYGCVKLEMR